MKHKCKSCACFIEQVPVKNMNTTVTMIGYCRALGSRIVEEDPSGCTGFFQPIKRRVKAND